MTSIYNFVKRFYTAVNPPPSISNAAVKPLKFGILGAAAIGPLGIIGPARSHPEAVIYAVAARDRQKAATYAQKHGIPKVYAGTNGYQELLDDPEIEAVYNPLPNSLHYEWTMKALAAGKHVLLEKPAANTAEETEKMFELAEKKGLILLEAFHHRFHPSIQRVKAILDSNELGKIKHIHASLATLRGRFKADDIRFKYELGGGSLMDGGCYTLNTIRYLAGANPISVLAAQHELELPPGAPTGKVDRGTTASLAFQNDITASVRSDLSLPPIFGFIPRIPDIRVVVECEEGTVSLINYLLPTFWHFIRVTTKGAGGEKERIEKAYTFAEAGMEGPGEDWWTTYRYQLDAFVNRVRGRPVQAWIEKEDSVANMQCIEAIYEKTGLGSRPKSSFTPS